MICRSVQTYKLGIVYFWKRREASVLKLSAFGPDTGKIIVYKSRDLSRDRFKSCLLNHYLPTAVILSYFTVETAHSSYFIAVKNCRRRYLSGTKAVTSVCKYVDRRTNTRISEFV